ncbi:MAG: TetR/AcrR family transcriptional regulator [Spirochaetia bacterium]
MLHIDKNDRKKKRVVKLFIEAAMEVIEREGIEGTTIRKVAELTGYNSATIYSYFDNLKQLIFFAAAASLKDYIAEMPGYIKGGKSELEKFLLMWECFCRHSFVKPRVYSAVFSDDIGTLPKKLVAHYYSLFPEELEETPEHLQPMLKETDLKQRNLIALSRCTEAGWFARDDVGDVEEAIRLVYQGMLTLVMNNRVDYTEEEAVRRTMLHIREIVRSYALRSM